MAHPGAEGRQSARIQATRPTRAAAIQQKVTAIEATIKAELSEVKNSKKPIGNLRKRPRGFL